MAAAVAKPTLLVLAAGIGSRYGGLKQIDPVGPGGEVVLDYSVYDAMRAGFGRVVFVIRRDIRDAFESAILARFSRRVDCACVFQELDALPPGHGVPAGRAKPWGTGHAVLVAADAVREPFAVINADDFYGAASFRLLHDFLAERRRPAALPSEYALVGFRLRNTLSEHGHVARGVCTRDAAGLLTGIRERTRIVREGGEVADVPADGPREALDPDAVVSMNMWGFTPALFPCLRTQFEAFLASEGASATREFYLPAAVDRLIRDGAAVCRVLDTPEEWFGVTYPADKPRVVDSIRRRIAAGAYPERLWA
jgi:hypothetical protein